jgi:hypothetical protein
MVAGHGFEAGVTVVYQLVGSKPPQPPKRVPNNSTKATGVAATVRVSPDGYNVVVRLAPRMEQGDTYVLWFKNPSHGSTWVGPLYINDGRPLWFSPPVAYRTGSIPGLPRELKVIGRNLEPPSGETAKVVLSKPPIAISLPAINDQDPDTSIEHYVARVNLPSSLDPGEYTVLFDRGDGIVTTVPEQTLTVLEDPPIPLRYDVSSYGCRGDDQADDTQCTLDAIADASANGGEVYFPPGSWYFDNYSLVDATDGIFVPEGVDLRGAGVAATRIVRTTNWDDLYRWVPVFILFGGNTIRDIHFDDLSDGTERAFMLQIGEMWGTPTPTAIEDITIANNRFTTVHIAIQDGGREPMRRVFIAGNEFQAYKDAVALGGNSGRKDVIFNVEDSIIANNTFYPGDFNSPETSQGTIASQIGGSRRLDFSNNFADGRVNGGWRAGFFFHMNHSHEMLLISENTGYCTGSKAGDGEFIALDNNKNTPGFGSKLAIDDAGTDNVTVTGAWWDGIVGSEAEFYSEHWLEIVEGKGIGQSRRITEIQELGGNQVKFAVFPPFDVVPDAGGSEQSFVTVDRVYWQTHLVDNCVDNTNELPLDGTEVPCGAPVTCPPKPGEPTPTDPPKKKWGRLFVAPLLVDSAVEGNRQYNSDGITCGAVYSELDLDDGATPRNSHTYFVEIRRNLIDQEHDFDTPNESGRYDSLSGIQIRHAAWRDSVSPVINYGISVSHNTIIRADGLRGGAISNSRGWHKPLNDTMTKATVIFSNDIREVQRLDQGVCPEGGIEEKKVAGIGIHIQEIYGHDAVLHDNSFTNVCYPMVDCGTNTCIWDGRVCVSGVECD